VQVLRRDLVDGGFAVAGGHHCQDVAAAGQGADAGQLAVPQVRQGEGRRRQGGEGTIVGH
jgi:hypothetical protein